MQLHPRASAERVEENDSRVLYLPEIGAWSEINLSQSCSQGVRQSISPASSVTFKFRGQSKLQVLSTPDLIYSSTGSSVSVNVVKHANGAPYIVNVDGKSTFLDSFSPTEQCASDFQVNNLNKNEHTIMVVHNGNSSSLANGRSTVAFDAFRCVTAVRIRYAVTNIFDSFLPDGGKDTPPIGAIVGAVLGVIVLALLIGGYCFWRRRSKSKPTRTELSPDIEQLRSNNITVITPLNINSSSAESSQNAIRTRRKAGGPLPTTHGWNRTDSTVDTSSVSRSAVTSQPAGSGIMVPDTPILPPYSPPERGVNIGRQAGRAEPGKAYYRGGMGSPGLVSQESSSGPWSSSDVVATGGTRSNSDQPLAPADIESIARRVVDLMHADRNGASPPTIPLNLSGSETQNAQIHEAVRNLLAEGERTRHV